MIQSSTVCFLIFAHTKRRCLFSFYLLAHFVQMSPEFSVLYPSMKIVYVLSYCHQHAFSVDVRLPPTQELSEGSIFFPQGEGTFSLNTAIDSQFNPFFTGDPLKTFLALPLELPRHV